LFTLVLPLVRAILTWAVTVAVVSLASPTRASIAAHYARSAAQSRGLETTGPLVVLSRATGKYVARFPRVEPANAEVYAVLADNRGGWWVGGNFEAFGGYHCPGIVHIRADLRLDRGWCPRLNGAVNALAASGSVVFIGGSFNRVGNARRPYLAAVNAATAQVLPWNPRPNYSVGVAGERSMAVQDSTLYVVGAFDRLGGKPRFRLGAVDIRSGKATRWNPRPDETVHGESASSVAPAGGVVFVDGLFEHIGGAAISGFAALDAATGKATPVRLPAWSPLVGNGKLYVLGDFRHRGGTSNGGAFDLPRLTLDRRWKPHPAPNSHYAFLLSSDLASVYVRVDVSDFGPRTALERIDALDATTAASRWHSPPFAGAMYSAAASSSYVLVGGRSLRVRK
jgi:hypothetical protein